MQFKCTLFQYPLPSFAQKVKCLMHIMQNKKAAKFKVNNEKYKKNRIQDSRRKKALT